MSVAAISARRPERGPPHARTPTPLEHTTADARKPRRRLGCANGALLFVFAFGLGAASLAGVRAAEAGAPVGAAPWVAVEAQDRTVIEVVDCLDGSRRAMAALGAAPLRIVGTWPDSTNGAEIPSGECAGAPRAAPILVSLDTTGRIRVTSVPLLESIAMSREGSGIGSLALALAGNHPLLAGVDAKGRVLHIRRLPDLDPAGAPVPTDRPLGGLVDARERQSFLAIDDTDRPPTLVEFAYRCDASPVFGGLVHDYRMGEAIALPGRFTPRRTALPGPTWRVWPGRSAHEVLRLDTEGKWSVVHLEVRRELYRFPLDPSAWRCTGAACAREGQPLVAAWRRSHGHGWVVGEVGARSVFVLGAGEPARVARVALSAALVDVDRDAPLLLVRDDDDVLRLLAVDVDTARLVELSRIAGVAAPVSLRRSVDGACIALVDPSGWRAGVSVPALGEVRVEGAPRPRPAR